jgi:hypothetical protein
MQHFKCKNKVWDAWEITRDTLAHAQCGGVSDYTGVIVMAGIHKNRLIIFLSRHRSDWTILSRISVVF